MKPDKKSAVETLLRGKCNPVATEEEAEVIIKSLESQIVSTYCSILAAPEINIFKRIAIVRLPDLDLNLINPVIVQKAKPIISFREVCASLPAELNCFRYAEIEIENGLSVRRIFKFSGNQAIAVQHAIDHLNSILFVDRKIKIGLVRSGGIIKQSDFCPCGNRKRFNQCCINR